MTNFFTLNRENLSDAQSEIERQLSNLKIERKDILRTQLLVEEIFMRMVNNADVEQATIRVVKNFFGTVQVKMSATGTPYDPLVEVFDIDEDDDEYYRTLILKANRQKMSWLYEKNQNVVTINVQSETNLQMKLTLGGMFGGLLCGVFMKEIFSPETIKLFNDALITPMNTMFLNALGLVIAPVIFFSVLCGVTGMGAGAGIGRVGSKLIGLYTSTSVVALFVGLFIAKSFFGSGVPQVGTIAAAQNTAAYEFSMTKFIVDIIPSNMVSPIADRNLLQVIFIAVFFGLALNALGNKVKLLQDLANVCNEFFTKLVGMIVLFVPLIAFFAMMELANDTDFAMILTMGKLVVGLLICSGAMLLMYAILIRFVGKISPMPFLKKIPSLWPIPFATSSSAVTMPFTMNFCTKKLGVAEKISSFSIPIGTTVNMNGGCFYLPIAVIMFLKMYDVEVDFNAIIIILTMTLSLSVAGPAVPNASVIGILTITSTFGVPNDIAGLLFCISTICDRVVTCFNVTGDVASAVVLSRLENSTDEKIYFAG
ncbi:MAG: dicarboxylate/amino acid:cation symporter [Selenomonadaceae bacterium]|nr:dicarboxylate/amino acid:cation symporter [Selenomonadaceae bacterium]